MHNVSADAHANPRPHKSADSRANSAPHDRTNAKPNDPQCVSDFDSDYGPNELSDGMSEREL